VDKNNRLPRFLVFFLFFLVLFLNLPGFLKGLGIYAACGETGCLDEYSGVLSDCSKCEVCTSSGCVNNSSCCSTNCSGVEHVNCTVRDGSCSLGNPSCRISGGSCAGNCVPSCGDSCGPDCKVRCTNCSNLKS